ncbi:hypothetical protein [Pseudorhodoferax sp.]|uniref:hypothetical protein n=1 Tax=Pseudorhodoferax sp. TaxID=1993553 RepID=UPI002DD6B8D5|nr:hypothetical protein [Pseudorhodoferax sp.]
MPDPIHRRLRIFALDPGVASQFDAAGIATMTINVPWEPLERGPVGKYVEVVDVDPASQCFYHPVDLDDPRLLAQDGLAPSETNPQFHQQMVYAVAMATIQHFERALGRVALWSGHWDDTTKSYQFVRRLRIYPHAVRDRNAYYSPDKKALLFGSFPAGRADRYNAPETIVHCALSHDIIAHEVTHALLDGLHPHFDEPVHEDVLAFHEAFADLVALFQHFAYPGLLRDQIARTRGNLADDSLLGKLAQQFGHAAGRGDALRSALGKIDKAGRWQPNVPDPRALSQALEPHARAEILVAAVFGAFLKVYGSRTRDLYRIASEGSGVLRPGDLHPDLANRLADEAAATANRMLQMCIRALDYCPPVGIRFGDYLRALVTADYDLDPEDSLGFRVAVIESFRQWGIHPEGIRSLSTEALLWPSGEDEIRDAELQLVQQDLLKPLFADDDEESGPAADPVSLARWTLESDRYRAWRGARRNAITVHAWLHGKGRVLLGALGLAVDVDAGRQTIWRAPNGPASLSLEVHSVRTAVRRSRSGALVTDMVVEILQRRRGYMDKNLQAARDAGPVDPKDRGDFTYRAGCTLLIDPAKRLIRRVIKTAGPIGGDDGDAQLEAQRQYLNGERSEPFNAFHSGAPNPRERERFALLHSHGERGDDQEPDHDHR